MILAFLPVSTVTLESKLGTSDIEAKLIAVEIVTGVGITTMITTSKHPENTFKIIEYSVAIKSLSQLSLLNTLLWQQWLRVALGFG